MLIHSNRGQMRKSLDFADVLDISGNSGSFFTGTAAGTVGYTDKIRAAGLNLIQSFKYRINIVISFWWKYLTGINSSAGLKNVFDHKESFLAEYSSSLNRINT